MQAVLLRKEVSIDEALQRSIGEFGWGQKKLFLLVSLPLIPAALQTFLLPFTVLDPAKQHWWECTANAGEACRDVFAQALPDLCSLPRESWRWTRRTHSIISEWNLVCGNSWAPQLIYTGFFVGLLIGTTAFGAFADRYGRRKGLLMACGLAALLACTNALAPSFWWYLLLQSGTGIGVAGVWLLSFAMATEPVGPAWQGHAGIATHLFFACGACSASLLSFLVPSWRLATFLAGVTMAAPLLLAAYLPESPRWLLATGRKGEAVAGLAAIASLNKTHLPEAPLADMGLALAALRPISEAFAHARLQRRLLLLLLSASALALAYWGVLLLVSSAQGSTHLNQALAAAVELPAIVLTLLLLDRVGRRPIFCFALLQGGTSLLLCTLTAGWLQRVWLIASKFGLAAGFALLPMYSAELFPASLRASVVDALQQAARIGCCAAPGLLLIGERVPAFVPFLVIGAGLLISGILSLTLPETLDSGSLDTGQELASPRTRLKWPSLFRPQTLRQWLRPFKAHSGFSFARLSETDMQSNVLS
ncbi:hypothetical protein WJX84_000132 [Apatococcus fuscideae]|uniref:Major facilitator superfamily (MFS) profile domain-containing protein n=1 Tax=Apatococcus fuscideae TaxID=2026836 RepID=A0AAW1T659_9CHLO